MLGIYDEYIRSQKKFVGKQKFADEEEGGE